MPLSIPCHTDMKTVACFSCHIMSCLGTKEQYSKRDEEVDTETGCLIFCVELYISQSLSDQTFQKDKWAQYP